MKLLCLYLIEGMKRRGDSLGTTQYDESFPGAVPNNHTPPDDDIERNLCAELFVVVDLAHFIIIIIFFFCDLNLRFLNLRVH